MLRHLPRLLALASLVALAAAPARAEGLRERELDLLVRGSTIVARAEVVGVSADGADLQVFIDYLQPGEKRELVRVHTQGEQAMHPSPGDRGLFFLGPSQSKPGAFAFVQLDYERWQLEPELDAAVDAFMARLVAACTADVPGPMDEVWLEGLELPVASLSLHSAHRLAALAQHGGISDKGWERLFSYLRKPAREQTKAQAVGALSKVLPADRAVALLPELPDGSAVKAALLAATGARAAGLGEKAQEQARAELGKALGPQRQASAPVALGAAVGLAALGEESAIPALERALGSKDVDDRQQAVEALAALAGKGSRAARARLHGLFADPDGVVRAKARTAWVEAYLADPVRQQRTRPSLKIVGAALVMILAVLGHSLVARRRT